MVCAQGLEGNYSSKVAHALLQFFIPSCSFWEERIHLNFSITNLFQCFVLNKLDAIWSGNMCGLFNACRVKPTRNTWKQCWLGTVFLQHCSLHGCPCGLGFYPCYWRGVLNSSVRDFLFWVVVAIWNIYQNAILVQTSFIRRWCGLFCCCYYLLKTCICGGGGNKCCGWVVWLYRMSAPGEGEEGFVCLYCSIIPNLSRRVVTVW